MHETASDLRGAVRAAARFLVDNPDRVPDRLAPRTSTQLAVLAIEIHDAFLHCDDTTGRTTVVDPDPEVVVARVVTLGETGAER